MVFRTTEVRWFSNEKMSAVAHWFSENGFPLSEAESRTDHYLRLGNPDIGVKLREGNVEVKNRIGEQTKFKLNSGIEGHLEDWTKWSFDIRSEDELARTILKSEYEEWIGVTKQRTGIKITENGAPRVLPITAIPERGCQIEYTEVSARATTWYTVGIEWFGDRRIEVSDRFFEEVFGGSLLNRERSMGYPAFLAGL